MSDLVLDPFDDDDDQTDVGAVHRPDQIVAAIALKRALPRAVAARLRRRAQTVLLIVVPTSVWAGPIMAAAERAFGHGAVLPYNFSANRGNSVPSSPRMYVMRDGTERSNGRPDLSGVVIPPYVGLGRSLIAIASDVSMLPPQALAAVDVTVHVRPLSIRDLAGVVRQVTGMKKRVTIDGVVASGLDPADVALAVRTGSSPTSCVRRMQAIHDKRQTPAAASVPRLEDLAGYGAARDWGLALVRDLGDYRRDPTSIDATTLTRSILLAGPPGVGKTLYATALARSLGVPLIVTGYADWQTAGGGYLNEVMAAMRRAFDDARDAARRSGTISLLFIDELDSVANRSALVGGKNDPWWMTIVNALLTLTELSAPARAGVVLIGATNHVGKLDPALVRSGRFDTIVELDLPTDADLAAIVRTHLGSDLVDADLPALVAYAPPSSGADAARWVREARGAARRRGTALAYADLVDQVAPADGRTRAELLSVAWHEAGHAVLTLVTGVGRLISVSTVGRGHTGGGTCTDIRDLSPSRADMEARVVALLAGRAADAYFEVADTGAGGSRTSDLARATDLVAALRVSYGLADSLVYLASPEKASRLLANDVVLRRAVEADLARLYARSQALVAEHADAIRAVAEALVDRRVLSGIEVEAIVAATGKPLQRRARP